MKLRTKKVGVLALAATAAMAVGGIGAGSADASLLTACTGSNIAGEGSSLQRTAQTAWVSGFNTNTNGGCTVAGRTPRVTYTTNSSGTGLNDWGADGTTAFRTAVDYVGTDDAPTTGQIANINSNLGGASVLTIPVAQAAIAIIVNPPSGCEVRSITPAELESVFRGITTSWGSLSRTNGGCSGTIRRVVRNDSSGTTYQLKHYLFSQHGAADICSGAGRTTSTWATLQDPTLNTVWPGVCDAKPSTGVTYSQSGCPSACVANNGSGGGDEAKTVKALDGSIGYAALSDARGQYTGSGPAADQYEWIPVVSAGSPKDPSSNGLSTTVANSNCTTTARAYGTTLPSATASWSGVYLTAPSTNYPICTLTFGLAVTDYSTTWGASGQGIATSVHDYFNYINTALGGRADALTAAKDYQDVPSDVATAAATGIASITD